MSRLPMRLQRLLPLLVMFALCATDPVRAVDLTEPLPNAELQQRYYNLTHEMRCMQCQNEALADSSMGLAADMRRQVRQKLVEGKSDDEIREYMVSRYSDFILFRPRTNWRNAWLWSLPAVLLLAGCWVLWRVVKRRAALPIDDAAAEGGDRP